MSDLPSTLEADRVYSFDVFARFVGISIYTLRNLVRAGKGPTVTYMSARRCGIRGRHGLAWLDSRASKTEAAA